MGYDKDKLHEIVVEASAYKLVPPISELAAHEHLINGGTVEDGKGMAAA